MKKFEKTLVIIMAGLIMLSGLGGCSAKNGKDAETPGINADQNPDKVNSLEKVKIGGIEQWIYINGNDDTKPVLLFLHGGPGYAMLPILHQQNFQLEDKFVVVNWDQRGAGLSYSDNVSKKSMTLRQFDKDVNELTQYLKSRFNQQKIYIVGHSFGTLLALRAVKEYPEDYWAYVGIGQVVDIADNEKLSYEFALNMAKTYNVTQAIEELTGVGPPDKNGNYKDDEGYEITISWVEYFGGDVYGKTGPEEMEYFMQSDQIYKGKKDQLEEGLDFSQRLFDDDEVLSIDLRKQIKKVDVPVYILAGRYDYDTPFALAQEYFDVIEAPQKEFIWFDYSAHFPFYEEPQVFNSVLIDKVLAQTYKK
jgi:pimeloyl-ACP methyl ester carboxylesterase